MSQRCHASHEVTCLQRDNGKWIELAAVCVRACVCVCVRARVCVRVCVCVHDESSLTTWHPLHAAD